MDAAILRLSHLVEPDRPRETPVVRAAPTAGGLVEVQELVPGFHSAAGGTCTPEALLAFADRLRAMALALMVDRWERVPPHAGNGKAVARG